MVINPEDINLKVFLQKFTFIGDPDPGTKIQIDLALFLQIASLLKISLNLEKLSRK